MFSFPLIPLPFFFSSKVVEDFFFFAFKNAEERNYPFFPTFQLVSQKKKKKMLGQLEAKKQCATSASNK